MTNKHRVSLSNFALVLSLLIALGVWSCSNKTSGPGGPSQGCGTGTGTYTFSHTDLPDNFDCNTAGSFGIEVSPNIDGTYAGFNRLYFELTKDSKVYRSNYVEFYSGNTATQQLEFGGSLPTGEYTGRAYLRNIQLNSSCTDKIYQKSDWWVGDVYITQFSNPQKRMNIEYNCQLADTLGLWNYDVFSSQKTAEYVYNAFSIANTDTHWIVKQTNLPTRLIKFMDDDFSEIVSYISDLKELRDKMFLCGIKGFKDDQGNFLDYLGITASQDTISFTPSDSSGSLIAVKACINYAGTEYKVDFNDLVTSTVIHELGHQRGILHHEGHTRFCRMNTHPIYPLDRCTYLNPHFCNSCINKIKNINW